MYQNKIFRIAFVVISLSFLWTLLKMDDFRQKNEKMKTEFSSMKKNIDSLQNLSDSLSGELFPKEIELGRYEVAFRIFLERNPKAASQFGDIISQETE